jgi:hypothetical protein
MRGAAALRFAVDGDLVVGTLSGELELPLDENALEGFGVEPGQHPLEGGFLRVVPPAVTPAVAAKRPELELGELAGKGGQVALTPHHAGQHRHDHDGQQAGQGIVPAFSGPPLRNLAAQYHKPTDVAGGHLATGDDGIFNRLEIGGQARGTQHAAGFEPQFAHPELLGPSVGGVVILATAAAALGLAQKLPALGLVAGAAEQLAVDKALGDQHGVSVGLLPVPGQPRAAERQHAAGQIGAIHPGQDEKAGVVGHQRKPATPLRDGPADPFLAILEVVGRRAPAQQGHPLAVHFGDIPQLLADQCVALEVVALGDEFGVALPARKVVGVERADLDVIKNVLFAQGDVIDTGIGHAYLLPEQRNFVQQFVSTP